MKPVVEPVVAAADTRLPQAVQQVATEIAASRILIRAHLQPDRAAVGVGGARTKVRTDHARSGRPERCSRIATAVAGITHRRSR